ncbi:MAG: hypothetical protein ABI884_07655 [Gemmatimonadota bacterium]
MIRRRIIVFAIALVAACGGDSSDITPPPSGQLSQSQVASLSTALTALLEYSYESPSILFSLRSPTGARHATDDRRPYSGGIVCPEGGRTGVTGTVVESPSGQFIEVLDTLLDCGMRDGDGAVWRFTSDSAVTSTIGIVVIDSIDFETTQSDIGRIRYTNGILTGSCAIDISIADHLTLATAITRAQTLSIRTNGTICGRTVSSDTLIVNSWPD